MRVKVKNPRVVVYCQEQGVVVNGSEPVEVKATGTIRSALAEGLLVEVEVEVEAKKELTAEEEAKADEVARAKADAADEAKAAKIKAAKATIAKNKAK